VRKKTAAGGVGAPFAPVCGDPGRRFDLVGKGLGHELDHATSCPRLSDTGGGLACRSEGWSIGLGAGIIA
jgi:hypothetical protein